MRVALINPNTTAATTAAMVALAQAEAAGAFVVEGVTAAFGAGVIVDEVALAVGARAVAQAAQGWSRETRPDAAIVAAFGDPGLDAVARILPGRAVGIGAAGLAEAACGGRRFAVATTTPALAAAIDARVRQLGLGAGWLGVFLTSGDPAALTADPVRLEAALADAVARAQAAGAGAVVIGGGPLAAAARALRPQFAVEIVEPVPAAARAVARLLGLGPAG